MPPRFQCWCYGQRRRAAPQGFSPSVFFRQMPVRHRLDELDALELQEPRTVMLDTIAALATDPPTADEVQQAATRILQGIEARMANAQQAALGFSESIAAGDWRLFFVNYDRIRHVTPADVSRVATLYFKPSNRTVGEFIPTTEPDRTQVPSSPALEHTLTDDKTELSVTPGEAFDTTPANIETHLTRAALANGVKLVMLPKATRGGTVSATIQLRFGSERRKA